MVIAMNLDFIFVVKFKDNIVPFWGTIDSMVQSNISPSTIILLFIPYMGVP